MSHQANGKRKRLTDAAAFLAAVFAHAVNLEIVARGVKVVFAPDLFFQLDYFGREEFHGSAAIRADHVMMAAAVELVFIAGHAVWEWNSAGQAALRQQLECAIDGGKADLCVLFSDQPEKLVCGKMVTGLKKGAQDGIALVCVLQAHAFKMAVKNFLCFAHGFARRRRMIINPSLQHLGLAGAV